jgi:hypothetical protein
VHGQQRGRHPNAATRPRPKRARATLSSEDLAALRENLHEQRLFRREQLEQLEQLTVAPAPRTEAPLDGQAASQTEVRAKLVASAAWSSPISKLP